MKKLFLISAMVLLLASCAQKEKGAYDVNVSLKGDNVSLASDTVILAAANRADKFADTVVLAGNKATFTGVVETPKFIYLLIKEKDSKNYRRACRLFLEEGTTDVELVFDGDTYDVKIKGGEYQTVADSLNAVQKELLAAAGLDTLLPKYGTATPEEKAEIMALYNSVTEQVNAGVEAYVKAHPYSMYSFQMFVTGIDNEDLEEAKAKIEMYKASEKYASNASLAEAESVVALLEQLQPGKQAPDFVQNDPEGNPVKFSDIYSKNKVTMVDFWASWCNPCRRFNPTLVKIYDKYHKKGFEVLAVSLDRNHEDWVKAIKDDKLVWHHVSDLGYWDNAVAKQFRVKFIPQNIIVDQNGVVLGRQVKEEDLETLIENNLK